MIRASQIMFWFGLIIAAGTGLYHTSDRTHQLERQLSDLDTAIGNEQQSIHVLNAEWVYLSNPARVEAEAKKFLSLRMTAPRQVIELSDLEDDLPARAEAMESVAVASAPIANVTASLAPPAASTRSKIKVAPEHKEAKLAAPKRGAAEHVASAAKPAREESHHGARKIDVAVSDGGYINDHMIMQHEANARPIGHSDEIGTLIDELGSRP